MFKDENGSSLVVVLIAMLLVTVLGVSFAFSADTEGTLSTRSVNKTQAYHLARSGVELGFSKIEDNIEDYDDKSDFSDLVPDDFKGELNDTDGYDVFFDLTEDEENNEYKIKINSTGTVNNPSSISETVILELDFLGFLIENPEDWLAASPAHVIKVEEDASDYSESQIIMDHSEVKGGPPPNKGFKAGAEGGVEDIEVKSNSLKFKGGSEVLNLIGNTTLKIDARFIEFEGDIAMGQNSELYLKNTEGGVRDEFENDEDDFGESKYGDVNYGIVYFENDEPVIRGFNGGAPNGESTSYGPESGYYFFPSGLELHDEEFEDHLIEMKDGDEDKIEEMFPDGPAIDSKIWK